MGVPEGAVCSVQPAGSGGGGGSGLEGTSAIVSAGRPVFGYCRTGADVAVRARCRSKKKSALASQLRRRRAVKLVPGALHQTNPNPPRSSPRRRRSVLHSACNPQSTFPDPLLSVAMSRRYDSRVRTRRSPRQRSANAPADDHLLARGSLVPGRICARGYLTRRNRVGHLGQGWHRSGCGEEGHQQVAGAGHISREALHPE